MHFPVLLFCTKGELSYFLESVKQEIKGEIESYQQKLLYMNEEDLVKRFLRDFKLDTPVLHEKKIYIFSESEVNIPVERKDPSRPSFVKGLSIIVAVPFEGNPELFYYSPSGFNNIFIWGEVVEQDVHMKYQVVEYNHKELRNEIDKDINKIKEKLEGIREKVVQFNNSLEFFIRKVIRQRKDKTKKDADLIEKLGIPLKKRNNIPKTYTIPKISKKLKIEKPKETKEPFKPEPVLDTQYYEDILSTINSMALTIERNPKAFTEMKEEDLRWVFLVPLNAIYEGQAIGETFNYEGKTDILIRVENKNVFIAECKIWRGEKGLIETIDQLLGYTSWRDTKTAILLFFKGKKFSAILKKIPKAMKSHPFYLQELGKKDETIFKYKFHHRDDSERKLILTVMAFNIPSPEAS